MMKDTGFFSPCKCFFDVNKIGYSKQWSRNFFKEKFTDTLPPFHEFSHFTAPHEPRREVGYKDGAESQKMLDPVQAFRSLENFPTTLLTFWNHFLKGSLCSGLKIVTDSMVFMGMLCWCISQLLFQAPFETWSALGKS